MSTVLETIDGGARYLEKRGIEDARRNMQMLVAHQLGCTRMDLYLQFDRPLDESDLSPLREALKQRGNGIPLQHLLGSVHFHKHEFKTDARALIPRPETEELVEILLKREPESPQNILDMGCGSGVIGLSLAAARPEWRVTLADVSPDALALAKENAGALEAGNATLVLSDLFESVSGTFDGIAANLPYVADGERAQMSREVLHDPALALFSGPLGLDLLRRFIPESIRRLAPNGWLALEIGHDQAAAVRDLLNAAGFSDIEMRNDLSGNPRFAFGRRT